MDQKARRLFASGCLAMLFFSGAILAGCWLAMIEFGAVFHESRQDQVARTVAWIVIAVMLLAFFMTCLIGGKKHDKGE